MKQISIILTTIALIFGIALVPMTSNAASSTDVYTTIYNVNGDTYDLSGIGIDMSVYKGGSVCAYSYNGNGSSSFTIWFFTKPGTFLSAEQHAGYLKFYSFSNVDGKTSPDCLYVLLYNSPVNGSVLYEYRPSFNYKMLNYVNFNPDNVLYCNKDIYGIQYIDGTVCANFDSVFFCTPRITLTKVVEEATKTENPLKELVGMLPIVMVCLVGFLALRKMLSMVQQILSQV